MGEQTEKLYNEILSANLTREQEDERIEQTVRAIETNRQLTIELTETSAVFLGSSDYILEQVNTARRRGGWITPTDLKGFINDFFARNISGTILQWDKPEKGFVSVKLSNNARNQFAYFCRQQSPPMQTALINAASDAVILVYETEIAHKQSSTEFLNHFHPLVKWIANFHAKDQNAFQQTAAVTLKTNVLPVGNYLIVAQHWIFKGWSEKIQIRYALASLNGETITDEDLIQKMLNEILSNGKKWEFAAELLTSADLETAWDSCEKSLNSTYEAELALYRQESADLSMRRRLRTENFYRRKQDEARQAIATSREKLNSAVPQNERRKYENSVKGFYTRIDNLTIELEQILRQDAGKSRVVHELREVAAVVCQIKN